MRGTVGPPALGCVHSVCRQLRTSTTTTTKAGQAAHARRPRRVQRRMMLAGGNSITTDGKNRRKGSRTRLTKTPRRPRRKVQLASNSLAPVQQLDATGMRHARASDLYTSSQRARAGLGLWNVLLHVRVRVYHPARSWRVPVGAGAVRRGGGRASDLTDATREFNSRV